MTIQDKIIKRLKVRDINIYPNYTTIFGAIKNQSLYLQMTKELGYLGLPLCYEEEGKPYCIAGVEDLEVAKENELTEIEVEVRDIPKKDRLKYLSITSLYKMKEYQAISIFIEILEAHFKTPDGTIWCDSLPKDRKARLAYITGLSESTIQRYLFAGAEYRHKLIDVQNGDLNWREFTEYINQSKNPSRYANEYDRIEKEREADEANTKAKKAEKAKIDAEKAEQERLAAEKERIKAEATAQQALHSELSDDFTTPKVYANKTNAMVQETSSQDSNQSNGNDNSKDEQYKVEKSAKPWLFSANINMESGLYITISSNDLCLDGVEFKVLVDHQVSGSTYSSTFSLAERPDIKIRFTIENYDELEVL